MATEKSFTASYKQSMNSIRMSEAQKEALAARMLDAYNKQADKPKLAQASTPKSAPRPKKSRWLRVAAVIGALCISVGAGGYAYATGQLVDVLTAAEDVFGGVAPTTIVERIGRPTQASATSDGVTITADAIMGDERSYVVVYSLRRTDGKSFGKVETNKYGVATIDGKSVLIDFNQRVTGLLGQGGGARVYDADPSDNAIQLAVQMSGDKSVLGANAHTHINKIALLDSSYNTEQVLAQGSWDLNFKLSYDPVVQRMAAGGTFDVAGKNAKVDAVSVSAVALNLDYTVDGVEQAPENSSQYSPAYLDLGDIIITMADGSQIHVLSGAGTAQVDADKTICKTSTFLPQIINPDEVVSLSFAGISATPTA